MTLTLQQARLPECLFFQCISGSKAYGTDTEESNTDIRGVFVARRPALYGFDVPELISDEAQDETYFEEILAFLNRIHRLRQNVGMA